jgi:hypothetical protein
VSEDPLYSPVKPYPLRLTRTKAYNRGTVTTDHFVVRSGNDKEWAGAYYQDYAHAAAFAAFLQAKGV